MMTPEINDSLREYCSSPEVDDWSNKDSVRLLHEWRPWLNVAFALDIATPAIRIGHLRAGTASRYRAGRNELGLLHQVDISLDCLDWPLAFLLTEFLRALLYAWQVGHGTPSKGDHCNRQLRDKGRDLGIHLDRRGHVTKVAPGPFTELLQRHGVDTTVLAGPFPQWPAGESKLKKWKCLCTQIWAAVTVDGNCNLCKQAWVRAEPRGYQKASVQFKSDDKCPV